MEEDEIQELIKRAEAALKDLPQTPWNLLSLTICDARWRMINDDDEVTYTQACQLVEKSPEIIRELLDALERVSRTNRGLSLYVKDLEELKNDLSDRLNALECGHGNLRRKWVGNKGKPDA